MIEPNELKDVIDRDFVFDDKAFQPGRRNDDVVDFLILCWCADIAHRELLKAIAEKQGWSLAQIAAVEDHVERVEPYLEEWGDHGTMEAMAYAINH